VISRTPIHNVEGLTDYDVSWPADTGPLRHGLTAFVRLRNEADAIPHTLPRLLRAVDQVLIADNGSTDGTPDLAKEIAAGLGMDDRLTVLEFPFAIAPCGSQHLATPPDSVHSLTYFCNWSLSKTATSRVIKWDGDMLLTDEGVRLLRDIGWRLEGSTATVAVPRHNIFMHTGSQEAFVDLALRRVEPHAMPNSPGFFYGKGSLWEILITPEDIARYPFPTYACFELRWLDRDEFDHWSETDYAGARRTAGKYREFTVHQALRRGEVPPGVVRFEAEPDRSVVDVITSLPRLEWFDLRDRHVAPDGD
jgi:hypothetical protein